jgi:hypothetical protein
MRGLIEYSTLKQDLQSMEELLLNKRLQVIHKQNELLEEELRYAGGRRVQLKSDLSLIRDTMGQDVLPLFQKPTQWPAPTANQNALAELLRKERLPGGSLASEGSSEGSGNSGDEESSSEEDSSG